jgi:hypothetical protein
MTTFDEREKGYEAKFAHDEEMRFRIHSRRDRLVGGWAASQLGLKGAEADAYAAELVRGDVNSSRDGELVARILKDFAAKGVTTPESAITRALADAYAKARDQVMSEKKA